MSKVITFSRVFPSYHPRKGDPTYFVEKILKSIYKGSKYMTMVDLYADHFNVSESDFLKGHCNPLFNHSPKHHTIRSGHRWKVGDKFSPRVWSGKPYQSTQITIAPDIEIKKVFNIKIENDGFYGLLSIDEFEFYMQTSNEIEGEERLEKLAANDGLTAKDLLDWFQFPQDLDGQIICWNENVNY